MNCLVTGAAGFIGSRLCARLLENGHAVTGVDCFTDYYPRPMKEAHLRPVLGRPGFAFVEADLDEADPAALLRGREAVFHLAAQAGVRASWGRTFAVYLKDNVRVTQRLLEAAKDLPLGVFVFASSSSVYGLTPDLPTRESSPLRPLSPYGVTKLAAEQLCLLYAHNYGIPAVALRYFTVYGPGQRPDMAFHRFFKAMAAGEPVTIYGDGRQTRDFTYVDDIVSANLAAAVSGRPGEVYNIGGGHRERLEDVIALMEDVSGTRAVLRREEPRKGDAPDTHADIAKAAAELGYAPSTVLRDGLAREWDWMRRLESSPNEGQRP